MLKHYLQPALENIYFECAVDALGKYLCVDNFWL